MKKAVMYGGGNIGRGFIGALFSASGYHTTFIDISDTVIDALNEKGKYPVRIVSGDTRKDIEVVNVSAVDGRDTSAVAASIAEADIMATAVGVSALPHIIPNIVAGLRLRREQGRAPLNILICENLMDANRVLEEMIRAEMHEDEMAWLDENVGLIEASIGRMVPVQTEEMRDGEPLRVCVEPYDFLPVDRAAFRGDVPDIKNMIPFEPFDFYVKRKLYIHNMGHATCAYLGDIIGQEYVFEAIGDADVYSIVKGAMQESAVALSMKYGFSLADLLAHIDDLLYRFTNATLRDTCRRVGGDPRRKLSPSDRLIGAASMALECGVTPSYIAIGAAAALVRYINENLNAAQSTDVASDVLLEVAGLTKDSKLFDWIIGVYKDLVEGKCLGEIRGEADGIKAKKAGSIV